MPIMNFVWPLTALYGGPLAVITYFRLGTKGQGKSFGQSVAVGTLHCGCGCTLGDLAASIIVMFIPVHLFGKAIYGDWLVEYIAALVIGILFQYFPIKAMKDLSPRRALVQAIKADFLSLTCWQVGMYGWMAVSTFLIFHHQLHSDQAIFWLMMQIGMLVGFVTAYPVNWWLIKSGIKEKM